MVLPHDVWYHYYDRPCEVCEEQINMREDDERTECAKCQKLMCYECRDATQSECHVCVEKWDRDDEPNTDEDFCEDCMESCSACDVSFHPACKGEHRKTCSRQGRAQRAVDQAKKVVDEKESEIKRTKRKLQQLEVELGDAKKSKSKAEKKLAKLQQQRSQHH